MAPLSSAGVAALPPELVAEQSHSDEVLNDLSVLDNYGLPPKRIIARYGNVGEGWRNMRKRLSELSLRGRGVLFL